MRSHVLILANKTVSLARAINTWVCTVGLAKVGIQAILKTSLSWRISKEYGGSERAGQGAGSWTVVTVIIVGAVYDTNCCLDVTVKSRIWRALTHTSPGWIVSVRAWRTLSQASHGCIFSKGILRTGRDAESSGIVSKSAPEGTILNTLPGGVLSKGVVRTPEDTCESAILSISPRIGWAMGHTSFSGIVSKSHVGPSRTGISIWASGYTWEGEIISVGVQILRTIKHTSASIVVSILVGRCSSADRNTLSCEIVSPSSLRTCVHTVVGNSCGYGTWTHARVGGVVSESIR